LAAQEYVETKIGAVKGLVARNQSANPPDRLLSFPFMLVAPGDRTTNAFEVSLDQEKRKAVFSAGSRMMLLGDVDVCSFLGNLQNRDV
jgi:hypothetical protein